MPRPLLRPSLAAVLAATVALVAPAVAHAAGNASRAAGFIESAQNRDGGFGAKRGQRSDPRATLWASVALLAAGKNPRDEFLARGDSADDYLVAHAKDFSSLGDLGLLALVQKGGRFGAADYGNPGARITARLTASAVAKDPQGVALAMLGLLAADTSDARRTVASTARQLLSNRTSDGAWGPSGNADSASTALVLQALAAAGAVSADAPEVTSAVAYLRAAQANDGAIAESTRVDKATAGGSVAATAFTLQALDALGLPTLRTPTGKTVRQGLTQYQQDSSGGLTSRGSQYSQVPPSVIETAQAFPAFNGNTFPLTAVPSTTGGPDATHEHNAATGKDADSDRVSAGSSKDGVSSAADGAAGDAGAFKQASADTRKRAGKTAKDGKLDGGKSAKTTTKAAAGGGGSEVSGTVVGAATAPKLQAKAGADDRGLTRDQRAALLLTGLLLALVLAGAALERARPRPAGAPPLSIAAGLLALRAARPLVRGGARAAGWHTRDAVTGARFTPRRRWPLVLVLIVGAALVALPSATGMWERAPQGARMIDAFAPYMQQQRLDSFDRDVAQVDAYAEEALTKAAAAFVPGKDPAVQRAEFLQRSPQVALFSNQWPAVHRTFTDLLGRIRANKGNYDAVAALPSFKAFPWFFVIPGALLMLVALTGLALGVRRPRSWIPVRRALLALGAGLLLAPVAFQMFSRAPEGGRMVDAFKPIETRATVQRVQGHFGTIAVGQGAIRAELVPALQTLGKSRAQIAEEFPAAWRLQRRWVSILNNLTPMIGVMSDNVAAYRAVAALPPFVLFPWLFALPGLLVIALALLTGRRVRRDDDLDGATPPDRTSPDPHDPNEAPMTRQPIAVLTAAALTAAVALTATTSANAATPLNGVIKIKPGKDTGTKKKGKVSGSYFRMIYPKGNPAKGPFFANSDSRAKDSTYTLFKPGIDGGLRIGGFQQQPTPPFAPNGFALANRIIKPLKFAGIAFSLSTDPKDLQSGLAVTAPTLKVSGRKVTGDLRGVTAAWNSIYFNQGSPKPNGRLVGQTRKVTGRYDARTKKISIDWVSQIVGGPFNDFSGRWHFEGTFVPAGS